MVWLKYNKKKKKCIHTHIWLFFKWARVEYEKSKVDVELWFTWKN